ncbi:hypothetical protein [Celeribacter sp.]|uniref:hypothetical protein n=1 Tax=Celeribacter sp. TaxID=1890673 RepID=UPI003A92C801
MSIDEVAYYYGLRTIARKRALDDFNKFVCAHGGAAEWDASSLASIDEEAINYAETVWPKYYGKSTHTGFQRNWSSIWHQATLQPAHFELAIWQEVEGNRVLQGLACGSASSGREHLTLNWVERNFGPEYIKYGVLTPILSCFEHYAHLLGASRALIKNPIDPSIYEKYGYTPIQIKRAKGVAFLGKEL